MKTGGRAFRHAPLSMKGTLMKKTVIILLIAAFVLAFAACKPSQPAPAEPTEAAVPTDDAAPTAEVTAEPTAELTAEPTDEPADEVAAKVAQYAELVKPQIAQVAESMKDTISIDVYAEERALVMEYRYVEDVPVSVETLRTTIINSGETYLQTYNELKDFAGSDEVSVILRYLASDGTNILDFVIDKDFVPGEGAGIQQHYASVEEFVASEEFRNSITASSAEGVEVSAFVEGKDIVVATKFTDEYDAETLETIKTAWLESISEQGDAAAKALTSSMQLVVDNCEGYSVVYRLLDSEGNTVADYRANID